MEFLFLYPTVLKTAIFRRLLWNKKVPLPLLWVCSKYFKFPWYNHKPPENIGVLGKSNPYIWFLLCYLISVNCLVLKALHKILRPKSQINVLILLKYLFKAFELKLHITMHTIWISIYFQVILYVYLIENIKRRRHDNTEERKNDQYNTIHKRSQKKPMTKFHKWPIISSCKRQTKCIEKNVIVFFCTTHITKWSTPFRSKQISHELNNNITYFQTSVSFQQATLSLGRDVQTYLTFLLYGKIGEYQICGAPPYGDIDCMFFIWSRSKWKVYRWLAGTWLWMCGYTWWEIRWDTCWVIWTRTIIRCAKWT